MTFHGRKGDLYSFPDPSFSIRKTPSVSIVRFERSLGFVSKFNFRPVKTKLLIYKTLQLVEKLEVQFECNTNLCIVRMIFSNFYRYTEIAKRKMFGITSSMMKILAVLNCCSLIAGPPIIVPSAPNATVIGGQSITLLCSHSHGNISWYKDGSDVPIGHGKILTIHGASPNDEGMYHCAEKNGLRGSLKVLVIGGCFKIKVKFLIFI